LIDSVALIVVNVGFIVLACLLMIRAFTIRKTSKIIIGKIVRKELHDTTDYKSYKRIIEFTNSNGKKGETISTYTSGSKTKGIGSLVKLYEYKKNEKLKVTQVKMPWMQAFTALGLALIIILLSIFV